MNGGNSVSPKLSTWLQKRCREEGLSYRQVASRADLSHATVAEIINGRRPSAATINKLAEAFAGNGVHQKSALGDFLLTICGYRSNPTETTPNEPLARLMDKLSGFSDAQLEIMERFADFVTKVGDVS